MIGTAAQITIPSRAPFDFVSALAYFRRRAGELVDATTEDAYTRVLWLDGAPALVQARLQPDGDQPGICVELLKGEPGQLPLAAAALRRSFGLDDDLEALHRAVAGDDVLRALFARRRGLRLVRTQSAFEALVWAVIGQQINLTLAFKLKSLLVRGYGASLDFHRQTYWAFPLPERLAAADPAELAATGLSRRKAATIVSVAQSIAAGELDLEALGGQPRHEAEARLISIQGVGPWTAQYTLLRGLGDFGAFPGSDLGLRAAAGRLYNGGEIAPLSLMRELGERWGEWRGYIAFYLWNMLAERAA